VVLAAFRTIGAVCTACLTPDGEQRELADAVRAAARRVDQETDEAFGLVELVRHRLGA
jgi:hypothetical protein